MTLSHLMRMRIASIVGDLVQLNQGLAAAEIANAQDLASLTRAFERARDIASILEDTLAVVSDEKAELAADALLCAYAALDELRSVRDSQRLVDELAELN